MHHTYPLLFHAPSILAVVTFLQFGVLCLKPLNFMQLKYLFAVLGVILVSTASAQQETYLSHFAWNKTIFNPAFTGMNSTYEINIFHHRQWLQLQDQTGLYPTPNLAADRSGFPTLIRPITQGFGVAIPISKCKFGEKLDLGGVYVGAYTDGLAYEKNTHLLVNGAWSLRLNASSQLRIGIKADWENKSILTDKLRPIDPNDPLIPAGNKPSDTRLAIGGGIAFVSTLPKKLYAGIGFSSLNRPEFIYYNKDGNPIQVHSSVEAYGNAGVTLPFRYLRNTVAKTNIMLRTSNANKGWVMPQLEVQYLLEYAGQFSMGTGLRCQKNGLDAWTLLLGFYPKLPNQKGVLNQKLRIGYSFDKTLQSLRHSSNNTHEIQINYTFNTDCKSARIQHARDLQYFRKID